MQIQKFLSRHLNQSNKKKKKSQTNEVGVR